MKTHFGQRLLSLPTWKKSLQNEATWGKRRRGGGRDNEEGQEREEKGRKRKKKKKAGPRGRKSKSEMDDIQLYFIP